MIGERFNFEDVFFRDLTVCVLDTLEGQVKWINRFSSGDRFVQVPFYYSLTGDERFLLDSFSDDIVSENRFVELNTDMIPRGHLTMTGFNIKSDEFANPNVWLRMVVENQIEIRKVLARVRAIPITVNYDLEILLSNEVDTFKCSQSLMDTLWLYKYMYFEYNFMNIDAIILMPDSNSIEMSREKNLTSDNNIKLKCTFTVETYYPSFRKDRITATGYPRPFGSGMRDSNGYTMTGGFSDLFGPDFINTSINSNQNVNNNNNQNVNNNNTNNLINSSPARPNTEDIVTTSTSNIPRPGFNTQASISNSNPPGGGGNQNFGQNLANLGQNQGNVSQQFTSLGGVENNNGPGSTIGGLTGSFSTNLGGYGQTGSFFDTQSIGGGNEFGSSTDDAFSAVTPKRTRWFNNILRARERASQTIANPNANNWQATTDQNNDNNNVNPPNS